jgi:hypothetical protein
MHDDVSAYAMQLNISTMLMQWGPHASSLCLLLFLDMVGGKQRYVIENTGHKHEQLHYVNILHDLEIKQYISHFKSAPYKDFEIKHTIRTNNFANSKSNRKGF